MRFLTSRSAGMGCAVLGLAGAALLGAVPSARAQYMGSVTFNNTHPVPTQLTDFTDFLTFQKFDSSLYGPGAMLTSITFTLSTNISTTITVKNNGSSISNGRVSTLVDVTLIDPGNFFPLDTETPPQGTSGINFFETASSPFVFTPLNPGQTKTSGTLTGSSSTAGTIDGSTPNSTDIFSEFTGPGAINVSGRTTTLTSLNATGGNVEASQITNAGFDGSVRYNYEVTPEPGTVSLLGTGLLMGGAAFGTRLRRRRTANQK